MELVTCENCGVVMDKDRICRMSTGEDQVPYWSGEESVTCWHGWYLCPLCKHKNIQGNGQLRR